MNTDNIKAIMQFPELRMFLNEEDKKNLQDQICTALKLLDEFHKSVECLNIMRQDILTLINRYDELDQYKEGKIPSNDEEAYQLNIHSLTDTIKHSLSSDFTVKSYVDIMENFMDSLKFMCKIKTSGKSCNFCRFDCKYRI